MGIKRVVNRLMLFFRTDRMRAATVLLLSFSLCLGAGATVFKVVGRNWNGWVPTGGLPWEKAYQTQMVVNGKRVELHVYTARYNEPAADQLKAVFASIGATVTPKSTGWGGAATLNGYEVKYVISSSPSEPRQYIFLSYSDPQGAARQAFPLPLYPNGKVLTTVSDLHAHSDYATIQTTDTSTGVHEFYRALLKSEGWSEVKPAVLEAGEYKGMAIYSKKGQTCFINVIPGENISSTVSILVEKGK